MQLIVVSLIGIPGSGKSTLAREILEMSKRNQLEASVIVLPFDDYLKIDYFRMGDGVYKEARENLIKKIEDFVEEVKKIDGIQKFDKDSAGSLNFVKDLMGRQNFDKDLTGIQNQVLTGIQHFDEVAVKNQNFDTDLTGIQHFDKNSVEFQNFDTDFTRILHFDKNSVENQNFDKGLTRIQKFEKDLTGVQIFGKDFTGTQNFVKDFVSKLKIQKDFEDIRDNEKKLIFGGLEIPENNFNLKPSTQILLILDDNMYFRSMRQRIRSICRNKDCKHFQIFLKSNLLEAIKINKSRKHQVPEEIIRKMHENMEDPSNPRTIFIESSEFLQENSQKFSDSMKFCHENLLELIKNRILDPEILEELTVQPKIPQIQSFIHEADLITRKELTERIKNLQTQKTKSSTQNSPLILNQRRKVFLDFLKTQKIKFSDVESMRSAFNRFLDE